MNPHTPPGFRPAQGCVEAAPAPAPTTLADLEHRALLRLRAELALVRRITRVERERVAALAEQWGHANFAHFLREQKGEDG